MSYASGSKAAASTTSGPQHRHPGQRASRSSSPNSGDMASAVHSAGPATGPAQASRGRARRAATASALRKNRPAAGPRTPGWPVSARAPPAGHSSPGTSPPSGRWRGSRAVIHVPAAARAVGERKPIDAPAMPLPMIKEVALHRDTRFRPGRCATPAPGPRSGHRHPRCPRTGAAGRVAPACPRLPHWRGVRSGFRCHPARWRASTL